MLSISFFSLKTPKRDMETNILSRLECSGRHTFRVRKYWKAINFFFFWKAINFLRKILILEKSEEVNESEHLGEQ